MQGVREAWSSASEVETSYVVLKTNLPDQQEQLLVRDVDPLFEKTTSMIAGLLSMPIETPVKKIALHVFARPDEFMAHLLQATGRSLISLAARDGQFIRSRHEIDVLAGSDYGLLKEELAHECTHAILRQLVDQEVPTWLDEGLAEYVSAEVVGQETIIELLGSESLLSLRQLITTQAQHHDITADTRFYPSARSLVMFLVQTPPRQPRGELKEYVRLLREHAHPEEAFQRTFGDLQLLESEWKAFNNALPSKLSGPGWFLEDAEKD